MTKRRGQAGELTNAVAVRATACFGNPAIMEPKPFRPVTLRPRLSVGFALIDSQKLQQALTHGQAIHHECVIRAMLRQHNVDSKTAVVRSNAGSEVLMS
jgi:hypothetical protein